MKARGVAHVGPPLFRYLCMRDKETIDVGWPVATLAAQTDGRVIAETLPAGRYVTALYTGPYEDIPAETAFSRLVRAASRTLGFVGGQDLGCLCRLVTDRPDGGRGSAAVANRNCHPAERLICRTQRCSMKAISR